MDDSQKSKLLSTLHSRFESNINRHPGITWEIVLQKLTENPRKLDTLHSMEETGGEPDIVVFDDQKEDIIYVDCAQESPSGRRSLCYDRQALESRKAHKPKNSVLDLAQSIGIQLLTESQYRKLQEYSAFDTKTSSWIQTPKHIRDLGGALFCDRRYDHVFLYHNGAESYYAARGFRGFLEL